MNLGIDLGTSRVVIYYPPSGILLDEPSVIAVDKKSGRVLACGSEAEEMLGRTPPSIQAVRPLQKGVIAEYDMAEKMLRHYLHRVCSSRVAKPTAAVSIADDVTEVERRSFIEAVISAGARRLTLVPQTVAAAIGAGLDVSLPQGQMVVNLGGGTTDAAVLTLNGIAVAASVRQAGMTVDEDIVRYIRNQYQLLISDRTAERVKMAVGRAVPAEEPPSVEVKGRDALTGLPRGMTVDGNEICGAIGETLSAVVDMIQRVLEATPPELAGDIIVNGICLTGGMAAMPGMPELITGHTGIRCYVASQPAHCVAIGAGKALQYSASFSKVYDLGDFAYHLSDTVTN